MRRGAGAHAGRADARRILAARALRGFADGLVSVLLAGYLTRLGFTPFEVGAIVTGTLLGSAALTIALGLAAHRLPRRPVLLGAAALMLATGIGFATTSGFWALLVIAVVGTLNPSAGDVSVFLPTEQAALAQTVSGHERTRLFAWYNVGGNLTGALGSLASGLPAIAAHVYGIDLLVAERAGFVLYALVAIVVARLYLQLGSEVETRTAPGGPLARSRRVVMQLAALFSLDSFGGGFAVQSLLVLWLYQRFALSVAAAGAIFFGAGILSALSQLVSPILARRIGLVRTMVYTHLPANLFLVVAGLVSDVRLAVAFLLARAALSQMDVPARQAYVMAVVRPEERAAAASVTNVPRSFASALPPLFTGAMLTHSAVGWPLVCGGLLKALYDVLLLAQFRAVPALDDA
ncbi:MAG: MFS transporter [Deltaproteobacteria bacterium]|nr:MAG: MFS transporter [Deltaproteobacteria bacterium]